MAARSFQITLTTAITRLSDVYIGMTPSSEPGSIGGFAGGPNENIGGTTGNPDARTDVPYRQIILQASGADAVIGGQDMGPNVKAPLTPLSPTNYGAKIQQASTIGQVLGAYDQGPMKLSDFYATGTGAVLHILATPY